MPHWLTCERLRKKGADIRESEDPNIQALLGNLRGAMLTFLDAKKRKQKQESKTRVKSAAAAAGPTPKAATAAIAPSKPPPIIALEDLCLPADFIVPDQHVIAVRSLVASDKSNNAVVWIDAAYPTMEAALPHMRDVLGMRGKGFPRIMPLDINTVIDLQAMHNPDVLVKSEKVYSDSILNDQERRLKVKNQGGRLEDLAKVT
jgi:hypothetical protein